MNFVPERFTRFCEDVERADETAREYEQSDSYRAYSFVGSFPFRKEDWDPDAGWYHIPAKNLVPTE